MSPSAPGVNVCVCTHHRNVCFSVMLGVGVAEGEDVCHCVCGGPASEPPSARPPPLAPWLPPKQWPCPPSPSQPVCAGWGSWCFGPPTPPHPGPINSSRAGAGAGASGWSSKGVRPGPESRREEPPTRAQVSPPFIPRPAPAQPKPGPVSIITSPPASREVSGPAQYPHHHMLLPDSGDLWELGDLWLEGRAHPPQPRPSLTYPERHTLWGWGTQPGKGPSSEGDTGTVTTS